MNKNQTGLDLSQACDFLAGKIQDVTRPVLAIEGKIAAGKSTLAHLLQASLKQKGICARIVSMDDYYLPKAVKRQEHEGNCDLKRVKEEVLIPFKEKGVFSTARFNPIRQRLEEYQTCQGDVLILEGNYSLHPDLSGWIDYSVFLDIAAERQRSRLQTRSQDKLELFENLWIPQSQDYFSYYQIADQADCILTLNENDNISSH